MQALKKLDGGKYRDLPIILHTGDNSLWDSEVEGTPIISVSKLHDLYEESVVRRFVITALSKRQDQEKAELPRAPTIADQTTDERLWVTGANRGEQLEHYNLEHYNTGRSLEDIPREDDQANVRRLQRKAAEKDKRKSPPIK